jgi:hypothetical protein
VRISIAPRRVSALALASMIGILLPSIIALSGGRASASSSGYRSEVVRDNPVSYWRLDDIGGTTIADQMGRNNGVSQFITLRQQNGAVDGNSSILFDGATGYIDLHDPASLKPTTALTLELWFRTAAPITGGGKSVILRSRWYGYEVSLDALSRLTASVCLQDLTCPVITSPSVAVDGTWHHVVVTKDQSFMSLYYDNVLVGAAASAGPAYYAGGGIAIARDGDNSGYYFNGYVDEVAVYDHVLTPSRVQAHYVLAPKATVSRYVATVDPETLYNQGCAAAGTTANSKSARDSLVILDFGQPLAFSDGTYGALLTSDNSTELTTDDVTRAVLVFGQGYTDCSVVASTTAGWHLTVGIGTNNYGSFLSSEHGAAWTAAVNSANFVFNLLHMNVAAVGASDIELNYNTYANTQTWLNGFGSSPNIVLDYGDAASCPATTASLTGQCANGWTQDQVRQVSYGFSASWPLPEIYTTTSATVKQSDQWYQISKLSAQNYSSPLHFFGTMTQWAACQNHQPPCADSEKNFWDDGFTQLQDRIDSDPQTTWPLSYMTDITWSTD